MSTSFLLHSAFSELSNYLIQVVHRWDTSAGLLVEAIRLLSLFNGTVGTY